MPKIVLIIACVIATLTLKAFSQITTLHTNSGTPILEKEYVDIQGSPYLDEAWQPAKVNFKNGKSGAVSLKFDLVKGLPYFQGEKGETLGFVDLVDEFFVNSAHFKSGFPSIENLDAKTYYQVVETGKVDLLKHISKEIVVSSEYSSATKNKSFELTENYLIFKDQEMIPLKRDKKFLLKILSDKAVEIEKFMTAQKVNLKTDADLGNVIKYYNTL